MDKQEWTLEIADGFINVLEGSKNPVQLIRDVKEGIGDLRDMLFAKNLEAVMNGIEENGTCARKIGRTLAKSDYGEEYGFALLHYIDSYEHKDKGRWMAMLLDSTSKGFISPNELFRFCKIIQDVSLRSLRFLKDNNEKKVLYTLSKEEKACVNELLLHDLMYKSENNGYAFSMTGFRINKYGLSYDEDKNIEIPELKNFPKEPQNIVAEGVEYKG
jgi:hypothetical protein